MFIGNVNILGRRTDGSIVYLLDTYTAAAAYSLRQLKTGVTNVVRVRRSSDNAESDFTADEITDGTLVAWTGANNGFVVTWYDQSGGGNDVTQATAGNQPQLVSSGSLVTLSGLATVDMSNTSKYLTLGSGLSALNDGAFSAFAVAENRQSDNGGNIFAAHDGVGNNRSEMFLATNGNDYIYNQRVSSVNTLVTSASTASLSTAYLVTAISDASRNLEPYLNGVNGTGGTFSGSITSTEFEVGHNVTGSELTGSVSEIIIFNTDESANRTDIESDINTYYSIY